MASDAFDELAEYLVRGSEQSFVAYLTERFLDMLDEAVTNPDRFQVLASRSKVAAMAAWDRFRGKVTKETQSAFLDAMSGEDELLVSSLSKAYGYDRTISTRGNNELNEAARGMAEIMRRQNVALADNLADSWYKVTSDAVTSTLMGGDRRTIMEEAVSRLSDAGLETIDYRSGVRTTIDAATRRHVVSQANQARADLLNRRCDEWGCDLVMVSAHFGARPSHAVWQGKVYSRSGNDPEYPSLDEGTGYHGTGPHGSLGDRLCGVNCLHSMTPYVPGYSEVPSTDFSEQEKQVGMTSDEWYAAKQRQRGMERRVRSLKRKVALGQERGLDMTADRYRLGRAQAALREHCATTGLRRDYERERAYAVSKQPTGLGRVDFNSKRWTIKSGGKTYAASSIKTRSEFIRTTKLGDVETAAVFDEGGSLVSEVFTGTGSSVRMQLKEGMEWTDLRVVHTHTSDFGGTFSVGDEDGGDIYHLTDGNLLSYEAKAHEGLYKIERSRKLSDEERDSFYVAAYHAEMDELCDAMESVDGRWEAQGLDSMDERLRKRYEEEVRAIVSPKMDAWFMSNAEAYGYSYSFSPKSG